MAKRKNAAANQPTLTDFRHDEANRKNNPPADAGAAPPADPADYRFVMLALDKRRDFVALERTAFVVCQELATRSPARLDTQHRMRAIQRTTC